MDDESQKKALRAAMLKSRFADTIMKANVMVLIPLFFLPPAHSNVGD